MQHKPFIINDLGCCVLRQFCAKFGAKRRYLKKIAIDNQQVTDGGRVLLNPASATIKSYAMCYDFFLSCYTLFIYIVGNTVFYINFATKMILR